MIVHLLSGGAAQGYVSALEEAFRVRTACTISGRYSAVGAMRDALLAGEPADLVILTRALVHDLAAQGHVLAESRADLGTVRTGIAVPAGAAIVPMRTPADLRQILAQARGIYFPDPERATAGIHFMKVLDALGLREPLRDRLRPYPNGTVAMREMAGAAQSDLVGCTQLTEIIATPGVQSLGALPPEFELATVYTAAVCARANHPVPARALVDLLTAGQNEPLRRAAGFQ